MSIEEKLGINKFVVNEEQAHIVCDKMSKDHKAILSLVRACPAGLYKLTETGELTFDYAGCLECGTCRVLALGGVVKEWQYPAATFGIKYRFG